jgi:hypothetical protein
MLLVIGPYRQVSFEVLSSVMLVAGFHEWLRGNCIFLFGRGHTKETGNHNATAVSMNCYQPELNTCY